MGLALTTQSCTDGWTIELQDLKEADPVMLQCTGGGTERTEARWQFLVFPTGKVKFFPVAVKL